jgi:transposase
MTKKTRRRIDAGLKAKIALEALREQATVVDLAQRGPSQPDLCLEEAAAGSAARAFDLGVGRDAEATHERETAALNAMIRHRLDPESLGIVGRSMANRLA